MVSDNIAKQRYVYKVKGLLFEIFFAADQVAGQSFIRFL